MDYGYIKIYRKMVHSDMYQSLSSKQRDVMLQCLLLANHAPKKWVWKGMIFECKSGQFVTSLSSLSKRCAKDVKIKSVRTSLQLLQKWVFLANESTKTGRLITILNWDTYQNNTEQGGKEEGKEVAKKGQRRGKEGATNKNEKNEKNEKNIVINAEEFLKELKNNSAYAHINLDLELKKMDGWLLANPGRKKTKRFVVNWLNKIEVPLEIFKRKEHMLNE